MFKVLVVGLSFKEGSTETVAKTMSVVITLVSVQILALYHLLAI